MIGAMDTKHCKRCDQTKPLDGFFKERRRADGYTYLCKTCSMGNTKKWVGENRDKRKDYYLRRTYGITLVQYNEMLAAQGGGCAICGTDDPKGKSGTYFAVDHNHETGENRGLLCNQCNRALGLFGEDINTLRSAIEYLEIHSQD